MPLPALPPNNTPRLFVDYTTGTGPSSQEHSLQLRYDPGVVASVAEVQDALAAFLVSWGVENFRVGWRVLGVRVQAAGSIVTLPEPITPALFAFQGTSELAGYSSRSEAVEDVFVGRSSTSGRRWELSIYRAAQDCVPGFRYTDSGLVADMQSFVNNGYATAIDGSYPTVYPYVNQNYNSYWERQLRV